MLDKLPRTQKWVLDEVNVEGDIVGEDGKVMGEKLEVWRRDPVECIRELIGNPAYREAMAYAPERVYLDQEGKERCIDEMWTADWWWETQVKLCTPLLSQVCLPISFSIFIGNSGQTRAEETRGHHYTSDVVF